MAAVVSVMWRDATLAHCAPESWQPEENAPYRNTFSEQTPYLFLERLLPLEKRLRPGFGSSGRANEVTYRFDFRSTYFEGLAWRSPTNSTPPRAAARCDPMPTCFGGAGTRFHFPALHPTISEIAMVLDAG
jgi:hypothetical protein